jgi:hypothetical protein
MREDVGTLAAPIADRPTREDSLKIALQTIATGRAHLVQMRADTEADRRMLASAKQCLATSRCLLQRLEHWAQAPGTEAGRSSVHAANPGASGAEVFMETPLRIAAQHASNPAQRPLIEVR